MNDAQRKFNLSMAIAAYRNHDNAVREAAEKEKLLREAVSQVQGDDMAEYVKATQEHDQLVEEQIRRAHS